jgi:hypothetical protein
MVQKENIQDQLDILATNLEIVNQQISSKDNSGNNVVSLPSNNNTIIPEIKKIQNWISSLIEHLIKIESITDEDSKKLTILSKEILTIKQSTQTLPQITQSLSSIGQQLKSLTVLTTIQNEIKTLHTKLEPINFLGPMNSSLVEIKKSLDPLSLYSTKLQNIEDSIENQKKILLENQTQILYLQKLQQHSYAELEKKVQQLPYRPVDEQTKQKFLEFPEDEQISYLQSIKKELHLSKKNSPLLFTLITLLGMIFLLGLGFLITYIITSGS